MEVDVDNNGSYSDEELPTHEPWGTNYLVVKVFRCKAQQEWPLGEWFEYYPVEVDGIIYQWAIGSILDGKLSKRNSPHGCSTQVVGGYDQEVG